MSEAAASGPSGGRIAGLSLRGPARLLSDERLVRRAASGERRAFEEIFRRYHQDLYRFCLATASDPQDAQEALQNTMVKVMRALPGERREIKLKPWLFRIARNEAVETMRKRRDTVELGAERAAASSETTEAAGARERLRELFTDLAELPERQRSALIMRELAGLDFGEIGETFGTSAAVARQTLYEARQSLRQMDEGREMSCAHVQRAISDADGRVTRRRDIRAHLRDCATCRAFRDDIGRRREDFAAVAPLPAAISAGLLQGAIGEATGAALAVGAGGATGGGLGGAVGVGVGKAVAGSTLVKSAATVAVVAAVGAGAADRGGLIDLPRPGGDKGAATSGSEGGKQPSAPNASDATATPRGDTGGRGIGDGAERGAAPKAAGAPAQSVAGRGDERGRGVTERPPNAAPTYPHETGRPPHAGQGQPGHPPKGEPSAPDIPAVAGDPRPGEASPPDGTPGNGELPDPSGAPPTELPTDDPPAEPPDGTAPPDKSTGAPPLPPAADDDARASPPAAHTGPSGALPTARGPAPGRGKSVPAEEASGI